MPPESSPHPRGSRALVAWFPDWPLHAARLSEALPSEGPVAVLDKGQVAACSVEAREEGVLRGLRLRDAQARCPGLVAIPVDRLRDSREFDPVLSSLEDLLPGLEVLRPGLCAFRARGAVRYYGSEEQAGGAVLEAASRLGLEARAGVADSVFAAEQAARHSSELAPLLIIPEGDSPAFLSPLAVETLAEPRLVSLLKRLGVHTLGDFAALPTKDVLARFGAEGALARARAGGTDPRPVQPRIPPSRLERAIEFDPGLDRIDQIAFSLRGLAEHFISEIQSAGLACTELRVQASDERGHRSERSWSHPHHFTAGDVVDRVRWQLQGEASRGSDHPGLGSPVVRIVLIPARIDSLARQGQTLFGGVDDRINHGLSRIQSMLGHEAVLRAMTTGGRLLGERRLLIPWGEEPPTGAVATAERPWPGRIPDPQPALVFEAPRAAALLDAAGLPVRVGSRGTLLTEPAWFSPEAEGSRREVVAWAGPWPLRQRWWDGVGALRSDRFQLIDDTGQAWLLLSQGGRWQTEARYD